MNRFRIVNVRIALHLRVGNFPHPQIQNQSSDTLSHALIPSEDVSLTPAPPVGGGLCQSAGVPAGSDGSVRGLRQNVD